MPAGFADPASVSMLLAESFTVGGNVYFAERMQISDTVRVENTASPLHAVREENLTRFQQNRNKILDSKQQGIYP